VGSLLAVLQAAVAILPYRAAPIGRRPPVRASGRHAKAREQQRGRRGLDTRHQPATERCGRVSRGVPRVRNRQAVNSPMSPVEARRDGVPVETPSVRAGRMRRVSVALAVSALAGAAGLAPQPAVAATVAGELAALIEAVPADGPNHPVDPGDPDDGHEWAVYGLRDSTGRGMDTAKIVADPVTAGRYIAVYHTLVNGVFEVRVATSRNLFSWTYRRTLDTHASQPTISFSPTNGPLIVEEAHGPGSDNNHLRFRYYTPVSNLLGGITYRVFDAPQTLSACAEGTPNVYSVRYATSTSTITSGSTIDVGHHYFANCQTDRQARGTLKNFTTWTTTRQPAVDSALAAAGAAGKHGDRDGIIYKGPRFSLIEGNLSDQFNWANWRAYLYDHPMLTARRLNIRTRLGSTSFANPSITRLRNPSGRNVLVVSMFLPSEGAKPGEAGQLLYTQSVP
jgi:hypothetical protein